MTPISLLARLTVLIKLVSFSEPFTFQKRITFERVFHHVPFSNKNQILLKSTNAVDFASLLEMDVVVYSLKDSEEEKRIGAIQEDGTLSPLSVWSKDPVYGTSLEFVVDEEDRFPGLKTDQVVIHSIVPEDKLSYGSRQVGGGKGPGNPHGEESELLYYVEQDVLEGVQLSVKPELEILW